MTEQTPQSSNEPSMLDCMRERLVPEGMPVDDRGRMRMVADSLILQTAIRIFSANCVACHGADGLGSGIAPAVNDPAVREKTTDDLTRIVTYGNAGTLMAGWSNVLTNEEISAVVTLITRWDEVPAGIIPAPDIPVPVTEESLALGSQLFAANCSRCHGPEGQGTPRAPSLNVRGFLTGTTDQALKQIITSGVPGTAMPTWGDRMTDPEIQAIVGFIRQWEASAPEVAKPVRPGGGGGGPPWLRNQSQTTASQPGTATTQPGPQSTNQPGTSPGGQGGGPPQSGQAQAQQTAGWQVIDWRILLLSGVVLTIGFTLLYTGISALRKPKVD